MASSARVIFTGESCHPALAVIHVRVDVRGSSTAQVLHASNRGNEVPDGMHSAVAAPRLAVPPQRLPFRLKSRVEAPFVVLGSTAIVHKKF